MGKCARPSQPTSLFAILGLRALYFALVGIIHRFHCLKYGLSLALVLVGTKMLINASFDAKIIPIRAGFDHYRPAEADSGKETIVTPSRHIQVC